MLTTTSRVVDNFIACISLYCQHMFSSMSALIFTLTIHQSSTCDHVRPYIESGTSTLHPKKIEVIVDT